MASPKRSPRRLRHVSIGIAPNEEKSIDQKVPFLPERDQGTASATSCPGALRSPPSTYLGLGRRRFAASYWTTDKQTSGNEDRGQSRCSSAATLPPQTSQISTVLGSDSQHAGGPRLQVRLRDSWADVANRAAPHRAWHWGSGRTVDALSYRRGKEITCGIKITGRQKGLERFFIDRQRHRRSQRSKRELQ